MEPKTQTEPQKHRSFFERLRGGLESLQDTSQTFERVVIDNLSAFTPWLAPLIPASMAYRNMITWLDFSPLVSLFGAAAVEFLGLTTISTALEFWKFNEDKRKSDNSAPFVVALLTGVFYVVIILTVNAMLELNQSLEVKVAAKAMLSLLSVVAAVNIALRSQHRRRLKEIEQAEKGYDLPSQMNHCRKSAYRNNLKSSLNPQWLHWDYTNRAGRPESKNAYAMLAQGEADVLIVFSIDRLVRPPEEGDEWNMPILIRGLAKLGREIRIPSRAVKAWRVVCRSADRYARCQDGLARSDVRLSNAPRRGRNTKARERRSGRYRQSALWVPVLQSRLARRHRARNLSAKAKMVRSDLSFFTQKARMAVMSVWITSQHA